MSTASAPPSFVDRRQSLGGAVASKRTDPIESTFSPNEKQEAFLFDTAAQILMSGTVGAGKSKIGCEKGFLLNTKYPGNRGLIVRKSFFDVRSSTINQTLLEDVIPESAIVDHNKGEHVIKHRTGTTDRRGDPVLSEIHYHGLDSGRKTGADDLPRKIGSHEYGWVFVDEGTELSLGEWTQLYTRIRYTGKTQAGQLFPVPIQQIFTATNPAGPAHWMYQKFMGDEGFDDASVYKMTLFENPGVDADYKRRLDANLTGVHHERLVEGKWVGAEGLVYSEYEPTEHLISPEDLVDTHGWEIHRESEWAATGEKSVWAEPPADWQLYRAIDFGYTNPFVCQWWARSPDDTLVLFREIYLSQTRYEEHAAEIERLTPDGFRVVKTVADHDAEGRDTLNREGVSTVKARKDVGDGILAVKKRLAFDDRGRADLYFMEGARVHRPDPERLEEGQTRKTVDEISSYVWDEDAREDDVPVKEDDHGMDAMRYLVYTLDGGISIDRQEMDEWAKLTEGGF